MICAIVDAYGAGRLLPAALKVRGIEYVHVSSPFPDTRLAYRPHDFTVDIQHDGDVGATTAKLRRLGVSQVVAGAESGVLLADELAAALGAPGNATELSLARRDKFAMQQAVRAAGLSTGAAFRSADVEKTVSWVLGHGLWPVVLKPVLSAGTDNVIVCDSVSAVRRAHHQILSSEDRYGRANNVVMVQEYLPGVEHYVNTVSCRGKHRVVEVWRYEKRRIDGQAVYDYEDLLCLDDDGASAVVTYLMQVLDALGIANGAAHTEIMLTPLGPRLIECGARLGGGQMPDLLTRCVGRDQVSSLVEAIAAPERFASGQSSRFRLQSHLRCVNLISPGAGVMPHEDRWAAVRALPSFAAMVANRVPGAPVQRTIDMATCPGTIYLSDTDPALIDRDYGKLRALEQAGLYTA